MCQDLNAVGHVLNRGSCFELKRQAGQEGTGFSGATLDLLKIKDTVHRPGKVDKHYLSA